MDYEGFKKRILAITGIDLNSYKQKQAERRINTLLRRLNIESYDEYCRILEKDMQRQKEFLDYFTINVTEFFRTPIKFKELETKILPQLLQKNNSLKIWSAGCSNGAEAYSVAIILNELSPQGRHKIIGTDIDLEMLRKARIGVYGENEMGQVPPEILNKYFHVQGKEFHLHEEIKKKVEFKRHNLLFDPYEKNCDLILCRNVVIYFTEEAKDKIYFQFYESLRPGGVLFVGGTERIPNYQEIGFKSISPFFYQR